MKLFETITFFIITLICPWQRKDVPVLHGMEYSIIFLSAAYDTIFLASLMLLSHVFFINFLILKGI